MGTSKIKILELFAGIGAASKALENLCIEHEIVDAVEIDKYAIKSFNAIHGTDFEPQDITKWDKDIDVDLIMSGSPCQDFSIAGKQAGGDKDSGTRSSLMYENLRIIEKLKPKYVIWENVKNLLSAKHRHNFDAYLEAMEQLGYTNHYKVLNAADYGVPQHRERVFTVSIRNDVADSFTFPEPILLEKKLKDVLEPVVDEKYYLSEKLVAGYMAHNKTHAERGNGFKFEPTTGEKEAHTVSTKAGSRPTDNYIQEPYIVASRGRGENNEQHLEPRHDGTSNTITSVQKDNYVGNGVRIRKLTPTECWRLMGFTKEDCDKASKAGISNSQLYKQAGNSIVVDVLMAIFRELL